MSELVFTIGLAVVMAALGGVGVFVWMVRRSASDPTNIDVHGVAERVRATGSLVGLEVAAKEIATATKGWGWLPPLVMSQARLAMIFQFEKQYSVDLGHIRNEDIVRISPDCYRLTMPEITGRMRLVGVSPYDIQAGKVLGLLDVIPMGADRQRELMEAAKDQAGAILVGNESQYMGQARASIERQLRSLLGLFDVELEIVWREAKAREYKVQRPPELKTSAAVTPELSLVAG